MPLVPVSEIRARALKVLRPPPKLSLSAWADKEFRMSSENSATPGRWTSLPFQVGIMDAVTDPTVVQVSLIKSARIGWTTMLAACMGYHLTQDPAGILMVRPDAEACRAFTKETISPMMRDVPSVRAVLKASDIKDNDQTLMHFRAPGAIISLAGAHSGAGLRSISRRIIMLDEVDSYPPSAGSDGDQVQLASKRAATFWNKKILAGSTPLVTGVSRIERLFNEGDRRRFHVPCPHCEHFDFLVFSPRSDARGHAMVFTAPKKGEPRVAKDVHFVCSRCGGRMEHEDKRDLVSKGRWVAEAPFTGHASFHIWAAYGFGPSNTWQGIADEFLLVKDEREKLRTFVNTVLGETIAEAGEAPDWEPLYQRREHYAVGTVPEGVKALTAGVDVHKDRLVFEVVGWGAKRESWSVDMGVLLGDVAGEDVWAQLDELLARRYGSLPISMTAVDSSAYTQPVYAWARRQSGARVMAIKGVHGTRALVGVPTAQDVNWGGKTIKGGIRLWPLGVDGGKSELYGWLHLPRPPAGEAYPGGWLHFPAYPEEYFRQLTAEKLVIEDKKGAKVLCWTPIQGRENHLLDCRVYARAAASRCGVDRLKGETTKAPPEVERSDLAEHSTTPPTLEGLLLGDTKALARETAKTIWATPPPAPPAKQAAARSPRAGWLRKGVKGGWL